MTPKLARLEELARKATPGPYHIGHVSEIEPGTVDIDGSDGICVCEAYSNNSIGYLCAASPDVILELIGKLKVARKLCCGRSIDVECYTDHFAKHSKNWRENDPRYLR